MSNFLAGYETLKDYSTYNRETLERMAKALDAIVLACAACCHGYGSDTEFVVSLIDTFEEANFKNYFNQDTFKENT